MDNEAIDLHTLLLNKANVLPIYLIGALFVENPRLNLVF